MTSAEVTRRVAGFGRGKAVNTHPPPHSPPKPPSSPLTIRLSSIHPIASITAWNNTTPTNMASEEPTPAAPPAEDAAPAQAADDKETADAAPAAATDAPASKAKPASKKASSAKPPAKARASTGGAPKKGAAAADTGSKSFKVGETVLARLKGYPPWRECSWIVMSDAG